MLLVMLMLGLAAGAGFGALLAKKRAAASSLEHVVREPAPPQPKPPQPETPIDPRLEGFLPREDGARLAYAPEAGTKILSVSFIDNGAFLLVSKSAKDKGAVWSVERFDLASATSVKLLSGTAERLASGHRSAHHNVNRFCYSERDSKRAVFEVWCADLDGTNPKRITTHDGKEDLLEPAISPDGLWIAFSVVSDKPKPQGSAIWKVRLDGSDLQQLTRGADDRRPTWSDDGRKLYFQRRPAVGGASWDMYGMDADGKNSGPILRTHEEDEEFPARRGASDEFVVVESASGTSARLKRVDAVTKAGSYLTGGTFGDETSPTISPDGRIVAFVAPLAADQPDLLGAWLVQIGF